MRASQFSKFWIKWRRTFITSSPTHILQNEWNIWTKEERTANYAVPEGYLCYIQLQQGRLQQFVTNQEKKEANILEAAWVADLGLVWSYHASASSLECYWYKDIKMQSPCTICNMYQFILDRYCQHLGHIYQLTSFTHIGVYPTHAPCCAYL